MIYCMFQWGSPPQVLLYKKMPLALAGQGATGSHISLINYYAILIWETMICCMFQWGGPLLVLLHINNATSGAGRHWLSCQNKCCS